MSRIPISVVLAVMLPGEAGAEATRPLDTITLDCVLEHQGTIDIKAGKPTKDNNPYKPLLTTITGLNESDGSAMMVGNSGSTPLTFLSNGQHWTFVEITGGGNVMVTSMAVPAASGETYAVHSRHSWLFDSGLISQWAGTCKVR
jgi:hypothetical protein